MAYIPHPVDLTHIEIEEEMKEDIEKISQNIHETWANERKNQGWGYGATYDASAKKHPCMIEYDELPEVEKDMDRATVVQTIKMLLWMGYTIEKKGSEA